MNEFSPRPPAIQRLPQAREIAPVPDYSEASPLELHRAQATHITRLIGADIGHFLLKSTVLAAQLYGFFTGENVHIDWDPEVNDMRPDLDEKERAAKEQLYAIWREMSLRRSVRQNLRNHRS